MTTDSSDNGDKDDLVSQFSDPRLVHGYLEEKPSPNASLKIEIFRRRSYTVGRYHVGCWLPLLAVVIAVVIGLLLFLH